MRFVVEKVDDDYYIDVIISHGEILHIEDQIMIDGHLELGPQKVYLGIRKEGFWDEIEKEIEEREEDC